MSNAQKLIPGYLVSHGVSAPFESETWTRRTFQHADLLTARREAFRYAQSVEEDPNIDPDTIVSICLIEGSEANKVQSVLSPVYEKQPLTSTRSVKDEDVLLNEICGLGVEQFYYSDNHHRIGQGPFLIDFTPTGRGHYLEIQHDGVTVLGEALGYACKLIGEFNASRPAGSPPILFEVKTAQVDLSLFN